MADGESGPIVVVAGPTASGKSALALDLAEELGGVVINADSMQVYDELRILSSRPGPADEARVSHRLFGVVSVREACSAARWRDMAMIEIDAAHATGVLPILAGGSGLYIRALLEGLSPVPEIPPDVRAAARARHAEIGGPAFHKELAERDPAMSARLAPGDRQRLMRAWEVMEATGESLADWQRQPPSAGAYGGPVLMLALVPPREDLYAACDARFLAMVEGGALDEVRTVHALGLDPALPAMKALGLPELGRHLNGECSIEAAIAAAQQATRRYAKRQLTWLRHQNPGAVVMEAAYSGTVAARAIEETRQFLLTGP
ncbi:MAG: tRNA (adenosine(37)-N6)-dimethylallyltransferase MiaA [Alphaproteobacteria bacterium]